MRAGEFAVDDLHGSAVGGDELQHDGQADAGAFHGRRLGGTSRVEGIKDMRALFGGMPGPLSATSSTSCVPDVRACRWIVPPLGEYLTAFGHQILENQPDFCCGRQ